MPRGRSADHHRLDRPSARSEALREAIAKERYGARAKDNADGSVSVTMRVTPGNCIMGVVLGYEGAAEVEGPTDVRAALRARVERLRALYRGR